jgi:4-hydroxybenzoate polyprenyltransferase
MKNALRGYLELARPANVCTAIADVTAGFLYMGGRVSDWPALALLSGASALLYAGGVAMNDAVDAGRDTLERSERPIPSGRVPRRLAFVFSAMLLAGGLILAFLCSRNAAMVAAALVVAIILYNVLLKQSPLGPATMGLCRALNLGLGMTVFPEYRMTISLVPVLFLMWLFVTSVTFFARFEAGVSSGRRLRWGTVGVVAAVLGLCGLSGIIFTAHLSFLIPVVVLAVALGVRGWRAAQTRDPVSVQRAVEVFVVSLIFFDMCIAWAVRGPIASLAVVVWIIPARLLARLFRVT